MEDPDRLKLKLCIPNIAEFKETVHLTFFYQTIREGFHTKITFFSLSIPLFWKKHFPQIFKDSQKPLIIPEMSRINCLPFFILKRILTLFYR